jgi:antitoxin MazE
MKAKLIAIGNSKGVRLPRSVIEECGFGAEIEMRVDGGTVVLAPVRGPREGWDAAFARMAEAGDDTLLIPDTLEHRWDEEEWKW